MFTFSDAIQEGGDPACAAVEAGALKRGADADRSSLRDLGRADKKTGPAEGRACALESRGSWADQKA
jgi:hypothetical protein